MAPAPQAPPQIPPEGLPPAVVKFLLGMPAFSPAPPGADTTMTTSGPDQKWFTVVAVTCIAIPGIFLLARVYTKLVIVRRLEPADYFIFLAYPLMVTEIGLGYQFVKSGLGVHQWQVTFRQLFDQLYWMNIGEIIYSPLSFLVKMSILLQYLRLFAPTRQMNRTMWYGAWATMVACFSFYTASMFYTIFYCTPRKAIWNKFTPGGKCHDNIHTPVVIAQGAFNMAVDVVIMLLGTTSIWKLQMPNGKKVAITLLFATGLLACTASAMRIYFTTKVYDFATADVTYDGLFIGLWTEAEAALCFIVACSLSLPKLFQAKRKHFSRAFSFVSLPFTGLGTSSRKNTHQSTQANSRNSVEMQGQMSVGNLGKPPVFYEDSERGILAQRQRDLSLQRGSERDAYSIPSDSSSESSEYANHSSDGHRPFTPVGPLQRRLPTDSTRKTTGSRLSAFTEDTAAMNAHSTDPYLNSVARHPKPLSAHPASGRNARLTLEDEEALQQFRFNTARDSADIEQMADAALKGSRS